MDRKGQVSMEFMVSVLAVLIVFVFCFGIFVQRSDINNNSFQKWSAQNTADVFSRNINAVSLLDNNSRVCEYIYWNEPDQSVDLGERVVHVYMDNSYADSSITTGKVIWSISDVNGLICFSKLEGFVVVDYS